MKFHCQWILFIVDNSKQFYTSHLLLGLGVRLGPGQCKHTMSLCYNLKSLYLEKENVLTPKVITAEDIQRQKEEEMKNSLKQHPNKVQ